MGTATEITDKVIFFDGVCNLCNSSVNFIMDRDKGYFKFASLQSEEARALLEPLGYDPSALDSIILLHNGNVMQKSTAVLEIARHLRGGWKVFYVFKIIPSFARDALYGLLARNRYHLFGKEEACRLPTPELRERFLGSYDVS